MNPADAGRLYPALDVSWPSAPSDLERELLLSAIDGEAPTAVEDTTFGARVFFATGDARDRAAVRLASELPGLSCTYIDVDDERWAERCQETLGPVAVGNVVVVPVYGTKPGVIPGCNGCTDSGVETRYHTRFLFIHPSMGFGTGHHASTRLCLELLQEIQLDGVSVLDVGTGSGVLAIAAALSGAATVRAIDNDPDALRSARENVELNGVASRVSLALSDLAAPERSGPWDVVTANLTGAHLRAAARALSALVAADGRLILGGIQTDEENDVIGAFKRAAWSVAARSEEDSWIGLRLTRSSF